MCFTFTGIEALQDLRSNLGCISPCGSAILSSSCFLVSLSCVSGRLLDATKNYMYVFLLAGSEVVLSAVVLATCNFLFIRKKSSALEDKLENITVTDDSKTEVCSKLAENDNEEEKGESEEQEKETNKEMLNEEEQKDRDKVEEVRPGSVTVESQEAEKLLKRPRPNGDIAVSPETCL